jgi:microcystin-dependent protein
VVGGRGANGLADFNAGKKITLPDKRGVVPCGGTAMGNADNGVLGGVPFVFGNSTTAGSICGEATHMLATTEMPVHKHPAFINDPTHSHTTTASNTVVSYSGSGGSNSPVFGTTATGTSATGVRVWDGATNDTTAAVGGGGVHNNTQNSVIGTFFRKL